MSPAESESAKHCGEIAGPVLASPTRCWMQLLIHFSFRELTFKQGGAQVALAGIR